MPDPIAEFVVWLNEQWQDCVSGLEHDYATCAAGCKDGYVPNPIAKVVLEVVTEVCKKCRGTVPQEWGSSLDVYDAPHLPSCTGRIPKDFALGEGALSGVVGRLAHSERAKMVEITDELLPIYQAWGRISLAAAFFHDPATIEAIKQAIEGKP